MVAKQSAAAARPMTDDKCAASGTTTDATRLAAVCDKIDEYSVGGATMSGKQTASICAMIDDLAMSGKGRRKRRRSVDSTHCYKQICHIGKGGFGVVSKARHCKTARTVAMKTFRALGDGEDEPSDVSELLREACFLAACGGHPYLVGFHGVARNPVSDEYSLVMEYVGPNLRDTLTAHLERQQGRAFPEADVRGVMRQLLIGAEAMHGLCVIHRDIKPENVLVSNDGSVVKICDFGLAMSTAESSRPPYDERVGTARYMAPEVLTRMPGYDERVDVWSLGCVMAELLSGEALFEFNADDDEDDVFVHLGGIFDVLGAPAAESFQMFMPPLMVGKVLRRLAALPPPCYRRRLRGRLRELFPGEMLSQDGFDVLKGLLACNPKERLTAAAALRLPWFTDTVDAPALVHRSRFVRVLNCVWALFRQIVLPLM